MKYIRTNIGLFPLDYDIISIHDDKVRILKNNRWVKYINKADTVEELCDELVLIEENYPIIIEELNFKEGTFLRDNEYEFLSKLPENPIIYGAIWVKGEHNEPILKSVAKMKSDGNLELLI